MPAAQDLTQKSFRYTARDGAGKRHSGVVEAASEAEAVKSLRHDGLFPIEIGRQGAANDRAAPDKAGRSTLRSKDLATFLAGLSRLLSRNVTLDRALSILGTGQKPAIAAMSDRLRTGLREGHGFTGLMARETGGNEAALLALIRGGEATGDLAEAVTAAARILEERVKTGQKLLTGLLYPLVLLGVALLSLGLILIAIIPQFRPLVASREDALPFLGRMVFAASSVAQAFWPLILTALVVATAAAIWAQRSGRLGQVMAAFGTRLPLLGPVLQSSRAMLSMRILGTLLSRDVSLSQAMKVLVENPVDPSKATAQERVRQAVEGGTSLSAALEAESLVPQSALAMVQIGEETGDLGSMILKAADDMEEASTQAMQRFLVLFEPALIVTVGLIIGVSLYALFNAIISVNTISF